MNHKQEDPIITIKRDLQFRMNKLRQALNVYGDALDKVNQLIKEHNHPDGVEQLRIKPTVRPAKPIAKPKPVREPAEAKSIVVPIDTKVKRQSVAELTRSIVDKYFKTEESFNFDMLFKKVKTFNPDATYNNVNTAFNKHLTQKGWDKSYHTENGIETFVLIEIPDLTVA